MYSFLFTLGVLLTAPYYLWRLRGNIASAADWRERFGFLPRAFQQSARGAIWIHAVSVGETMAVASLVREIQQRHPGRKIFLSHVTVAGRKAGESRLPDIDGRFLLPLDWASSMRRAFRRIRPELLVVVETELWPNLLRVAREAGARVVVVNGRISDRSFPRYRWIRFFFHSVLGNVDWICAQSNVDAERFHSLGAARGRIVVTGNLKFDARPPELGEFAQRLARALATSDRRPLLVAASTMPGEEGLLIPVWHQVRARNPRAMLILAPRHPARFEEVASLLEERRSGFVRRTRLAAEGQTLASQLERAEILLLDTIGELAGIFELADAVFMGGSLVPTGGHNVLEPAYWAKPILFGPHMHNFRDIAQLLLNQNAAIQVQDAASLSAKLDALFSHPERRNQLGAAARKVLDDQRGATVRVLEILEQWLGPPSTDAPPANQRTS
ncbi:MAG: 3-deoxy-D-manno-octulosonic acid transferase [Acidobacteria bacterium]|nr:3-deoxy-D-manno-octulosonic acid transferase [Acidobacteriota bacterium]